MADLQKEFPKGCIVELTPDGIRNGITGRKGNRGVVVGYGVKNPATLWVNIGAGRYAYHHTLWKRVEDIVDGRSPSDRILEILAPMDSHKQFAILSLVLEKLGRVQAPQAAAPANETTPR